MKKILSDAAKAAENMEAVLVELIGPVGEKYVAPIRQIIKIETEKYQKSAEFEGMKPEEKSELIAARKEAAETAAVEAAKARVAVRKAREELPEKFPAIVIDEIVTEVTDESEKVTKKKTLTKK